MTRQYRIKILVRKWRKSLWHFWRSQWDPKIQSIFGFVPEIYHRWLPISLWNIYQMFFFMNRIFLINTTHIVTCLTSICYSSNMFVILLVKRVICVLLKVINQKSFLLIFDGYKEWGEQCHLFVPSFWKSLLLLS